MSKPNAALDLYKKGAEELKTQLELADKAYLPNITISKGYGHLALYALECMIEIIENRPEEEPEGEWVWKSNGYTNRLHCSLCNKTVDLTSPYCPHCGSKMKERMAI